MVSQPIGVFDSGLGGASVLREILRVLPNEQFIYYSDNRNAPYGDRPLEEIASLTFAAADFLLAHNIKALVVACNTATAASMEVLRPRLSIPVISVEPAIKPACMRPGDGKILMMATTATTRLPRYQALKQRMIDPDRVIDVPCPGIVQRIEAGIFGADQYDDLFDTFFQPYLGMKIDSIVLGCTHFPFIKPAIARYASTHFAGECALIDGGLATAKQLARVLEQQHCLNPHGNGEITFYTSGDRSHFFTIFDQLVHSAS